jgi:(1->4)-alpha-D-glucan 1-alpha-D-glucosylmutase
MDYQQSIHDCAREHGIQADYYDIWGQHHQVPVTSKLALLQAMRIQPKTAPAEQRLLPPVLVVPYAQQLITVPLHTEVSLEWRLEDEQGQSQQGVLEPQQTNTAGWRLPLTLDCGYYRLCLADCECVLIITPTRCYQAPVLAADGKAWGLAVQLYALRSQRNWGIGDFSDLQQALRTAADLGAATLGINPLHALFPHDPQRYSPYSPSSRRFLNPLYLDVQAVPEYLSCTAAQATVAAAAFQAQLHALRDAELIDYPAVAALKLQVLRQVFACFRTLDSAHPRQQAFADYRREAGESLRQHALAEALQAWFYKQDQACNGWRSWLPSYRDPASAYCAQFATEQADEVLFFSYLQWLTHEQLQAAQRLAQDLGLGIGLYCDLAVGVDSEGAEVWAEQAIYAYEARIGAPPDDFSPTGQDWGLAPYHPTALRNSGYQAFIATLRATMRYAGALRIDHVMGLSRLFWAPPNQIAAMGAYVTYPFAELLGILALESQRNRCVVIGEDLGTVEDHVRTGLDKAGVLSYRVLYFEKNWHSDQSFKSPEAYPKQALVTASTHDLPTLTGFWQERDLALRAELDLYPSESIKQQLRADRSNDKTSLVNALNQAGLWQENSAPEQLSPAVQSFLARSPAQLLMVQLEDILGCTEQANLPGTVDEYPNWRRKLSLSIEDWADDKRFQQLAEIMRTEHRAAG